MSKQLPLKQCKTLLRKAYTIGMDCYCPGLHLLSTRQIRTEYERIAPLYPDYKAQFETEREEIVRSTNQLLAQQESESRSISFESWSRYFSTAVWERKLEAVLRFYHSQPENGFQMWKQEHACPDWLQETIDRWEQWKAKQGGRP